MKNRLYLLSKPKKLLLIVLGFISIGLAILGIFLPILPTTPFLLLSAYLFARSSERLYNWLLSTKHFGKIIRNYKENKGVTLGIKVYALIFLWLTILTSVIFILSPILLDILLLLIATVVSYHILKLKTIKETKK
ncbi:MAG: YbaN family protein [Ignavibacteria bacterium]|nr:YbaN family protein [Ignavibacteria bacterium]